MEIYLIRHTTPDIGKGICYGATDLDVVALFEDEVKEVLKELPASFDAVYSSPLKRCHKLAKKITPEPILDDRLKEMDFGDWELQVWEDIPKSEIQPWFDDWVNVFAKGGECYTGVYERSVAFLNSIMDRNMDKKIAIVSHAGVIRAMNAHLNDIPLKNSFDLKLEYGGVIKVNLVK